MTFAPNALYYGDCLDWMREWPGEQVDLIYLDPPFNSDADYNMLYGGGGRHCPISGIYRYVALG